MSSFLEEKVMLALPVLKETKTEMKLITNPITSKEEDWTESDAEVGVDGGFLCVAPVNMVIKHEIPFEDGYVKEGRDDGGYKEHNLTMAKLVKTYLDEDKIPKELLHKANKILHEVDESIGTNVGVVNGSLGGDGCASVVYRTNNKDIYQVLYTGSQHGFPWNFDEEYIKETGKKTDIDEKPAAEYIIQSSNRIWVGDPTYFQEDNVEEVDEDDDNEEYEYTKFLKTQVKKIDEKSGMIVPLSFENGHDGCGFICQFPKTGSIKVQEYITIDDGIVAVVLLTWIP